jgi:hypothetical protein
MFVLCPGEIQKAEFNEKFLTRFFKDIACHASFSKEFLF